MPSGWASGSPAASSSWAASSAQPVSATLDASCELSTALADSSREHRWTQLDFTPLRRHRVGAELVSIAARAGAPVTPKSFHPVMRGMLMTGDRPLDSSAGVSGGHGFSSEVSDRSMWLLAANVPAQYRGPVLEAYDREWAVTLERARE
jgi:hypothetical protein